MKQTNYLKFVVAAAASVMLVGCAGTRYNRSTGQYIDDKATAARVNSALHKDSLLDSSDINVESFRGNVHLTGFVDHPVQKERASELTRNVKGVEWFKNDIVVKSALPGESEAAQAGRQMNEPAGAERNSQYQQQNQQNFQSGSSSEQGSANGWQKGALNVYDPAAKIETQPSAAVGTQGSANSTSQPSLSQSEQRGASRLLNNEPAGTSNDLAQRVTTQLRSGNSSAAQNIQVQNDGNGKITLRGTVASESEKDSIESAAKAVPGVNDVDNEIEVRNQ